jgi:MATE family multidrug resistance protein
MRIRLLGGVGFALMSVGESFYRGIGRTTVLMWCGFGQLALNCGLNYLLIFGKLGAPRLGAEGAAWGTCAAQLALGLFLLARILGPAESSRLYGFASTWRFAGRIFKALVSLSLPIGTQFFMEMGGVTVFCAVVASLGEAQMAATNVAIQVWSLTFAAAMALGIGATTLVGQSIGAGHPGDARAAVKRVLNLGYGLAALMGTLYVTVPEGLMALFVNDADLELVRPFARPIFLVIVISVVFDMVFHVLSGAMRGSGDTKYPMWVVIGSTWLVWVPGILVMAPAFGLLGAWSCVIVHTLVVAGLLVWRFRGETWLKPPVEQAERTRQTGLVVPN